MASKIKTITVSNLKAISALTADFNGCTAIITGGNNLGKSSFLKSLPDRIRGLKPDTVLKHEEKEGSAELILTTGERFIWSFTPKGEKLLFITEKNIRSSVTKEIAGYYFPQIFDVDKFLEAGPKDQKKTLQKLSGIDFTEIDKAYADAYEQRAFFNKQLKIEQAKSEVVDDKLPTEEIKFDDLLTELNSIEVHNLRIDNVKQGLTARNQQSTDISNEILELEEKIKNLTEKRALVIKEIEDGEAWLKEEKNQPKTNKEELEKQITEAKLKNIAIAENNKAIKQQEEIRKAEENAKYYDDECKRIEAEKLEYIKRGNMPEGFGFSDDGITYNGFDFSKEQLSSSGIYIAALKLAAVGLGEVKTLHFDASFLDKNSLAEIEKWAEDNDLQLLIEIPDREAGDIQYKLVCPKDTTSVE